MERGASSLTAEQFLAVLRLFNVPVSTFDPASKPDRDAELQNALARLGATDLHESEDLLPAADIEDVTDAVRETITSGPPRLLTALAPVLVLNADRISLRRLDAELTRVGLERRLGWLLENVVDALREELPTTPPGPWSRRLRRASLLFETHLDSAARRHAGAEAATDVLDASVRSKRTLELLKESGSAASRRWGIITRLTPTDFANALRSAHVGA